MDSDTPPRAADIEIMAGPVFTTARVGGSVVAVRWGTHVTDGSGPASEWPSEAAAVREMMRIAMAAADGAATVVARDGR